MSATTEFLRDLGTATKNVPTEAAQWWHDGHRFAIANRYDYKYEYGQDDMGRPVPVAQIRYERDDYVLWKRLGYVSDALLVVIVILLLLAVLL